MGSGRWSTDVYDAAARYRAATGTGAFAYTDTGATHVHPDLDPYGVTVRESRDSAEHPRSLAIAVLFDVTGSMRNVPRTLQAKLPQLLGLLLRKYRDIFFAMLSLAFSMILYGLLVKTSALGSSDGFNVAAKTLFGIRIAGTEFERYVIFAVTVLVAFAAAVCMHKYLASHMGRLAGAIRDNELRVEYMGASVRNTIHVNYVMSAVLAGLGGALAAVSVGHIDPEMSYWTTSGEFVFVAILAGTGNVLAPFLGAFIFETIRSFAYEYSPNTWQMALGTTMLLVIMFLPGGLWSLFTRMRRAA